MASRLWSYIECTSFLREIFETQSSTCIPIHVASLICEWNLDCVCFFLTLFQIRVWRLFIWRFITFTISITISVKKGECTHAKREFTSCSSSVGKISTWLMPRLSGNASFEPYSYGICNTARRRCVGYSTLLSHAYKRTQQRCLRRPA